MQVRRRGIGLHHNTIWENKRSPQELSTVQTELIHLATVLWGGWERPSAGRLPSLDYICWVELPFQVLLSSSLSSWVLSLQILPSFLKSLGCFSWVGLEGSFLSGRRGKCQGEQRVRKHINTQRCWTKSWWNRLLTNYRIITSVIQVSWFLFLQSFWLRRRLVVSPTWC